MKNFLRATTWERRAVEDPQVSQLHDALTAPPSPAELAGEEDAVALFRSSSARRRPARRRLWRPAVLLAAATAGALGLSGVAAAAYSGALPDTLQDAAHHTIGAPAAHPHAKPSGTPVGPDATGPAAHGLCTAFDKERTHGKVAERSTAYRNLVTAAGGADKIAAYCATVPTPGPSVAPSATPTPRPHGKPTSLPNGKVPGAGKPTAHPSGAPTPNPGTSHRP